MTNTREASGPFGFGALLVVALGLVFYIKSRWPEVFMGHGRLFGCRWVELIPLGACIMTGLATSVALFSATQYAEEKYTSSRFKAKARVLMGAMDQSLQAAVHSLDTLEAYFRVTEDVSLSGFRTFTNQKMLNQPMLGSFTYFDMSPRLEYMVVKYISPQNQAELYEGRFINKPAYNDGTEDIFKHTEKQQPVSSFDTHLWHQAFLSVYRNDVSMGSLKEVRNFGNGVVGLVLPSYRKEGTAFTHRPASRQKLEAFMAENIEGFLMTSVHFASLVAQAKSVTGVKKLNVKVYHSGDVFYQDNTWQEASKHLAQRSNTSEVRAGHSCFSLRKIFSAPQA